jgi:hypothetical protein
MSSWPQELSAMLSRTRPKPFLDDTRRNWQFDAFAWLLRNGGGYPRFEGTALVLPVEAHFPDAGMSGNAAATALFRRVRDHAGMADWPCAVEPAARGPRSAAPASIPVIRYEPAEESPLSLVPCLARALAGFFVETFDEPPPGGAALSEPAIDLATVFMGFGVFLANSAFESARQYDLNEGELVHALAIFCLLRKMDTASVEPHLNAHLRKYLRLASRDLVQYKARFQKLRSVFAVHSFDASALPPLAG